VKNRPLQGPLSKKQKHRNDAYVPHAASEFDSTVQFGVVEDGRVVDRVATVMTDARALQ